MLQANILIGFLSFNLESILAQNNIRDPCTNECQLGELYIFFFIKSDKAIHIHGVAREGMTRQGRLSDVSRAPGKK